MQDHVKMCPETTRQVTLPDEVPDRFTVIKRRGQSGYRACAGSARGSQWRPQMPTLFSAPTLEALTQQIVQAWPNEVTGCRRQRRTRTSPTDYWILVPRSE